MFNISAKAQAILDALNLSQAVIEFHPDGTIIKANKNFLNAMGYNLEEIQGKHHRMFVSTDYANSSDYRKFWEDLAAGNFQSSQYQRFGKGGKEIWIQASYNPVKTKSGKTVKIVKYATDVTNVVMEKAELEGQIDAIGKAQAVIHFNLDGTIQWANPNFLGALGYTLDEIQGKHHRIFVEPEHAQTDEYRRLWDELRAGHFQAGEFKRISKEGKEIWIQASYNPIFDPNGKVFKIIKFATDITPQYIKRMESERIGNIVDQNLNKIVHAVGDATDQSGKAAVAAGQASEKVGTVAAGTEELNSSIREISQSMSLSQSAVANAMELTENADKSTQELSSAAGQMTGIVSLIQDIANQINLLALNATIESARAGDAGKGFAVVASEVKSLANQVAQATDKISSEIVNMQDISGNVVGMLQNIRQSINEIQHGVASVASAIEEQSAVTQDISHHMQNAADAVKDVDQGLKSIVISMQTSSGLATDGLEMYKELRRI